MKKRLLPLLLALCMALSLLPGTALAAEPSISPRAAMAGGQAEEPAVWRFLFVILKKNDITYRDVNGVTRRETNAMTSAEVQAIRYACGHFKTYFTKNAGKLVKPVIDIVEITTPITQLSATAVSGSPGKNDSLRLSWSDCLPLIRSKRDVSQYDHVTAIANLNTIQTPSYWGLTGGGFPQGTGYSFVNTMSREKCLHYFSSSQPFPSSVFVHEFLHFAHNWSKSRTGQEPSVNNHQAVQYGYDDSNHGKFYADLINKRVVDSSGNPAGIDPAAWANPPCAVRKGVKTSVVGFWCADQGASICPPVYVTNGKPYGALPTPTRAGYTFKGWYADANTYNVQVKAADKVHLTGDQWLYARWEPVKGSKNYTVTLDRVGGGIPVTAETKHVTYGKPYGELPTPVREGYNFSGWYTAKTGGKKVTASTKVTASKDHTLYARWTKKASVAVTLNPNGGRFVDETGKVTVTKGSPYGALPSPVRTGYTFAGWYTAKSGGKKITADTTVTAGKSQTLYARWVKGRTFRVAFHPNGGEVMQDQISVIYSGVYGRMPTPTREGYHFAGWYTSKTGGSRITPESKAAITSSQTLYARWTKSPVTVVERRSGSWKVTIPIGCNMLFYSNETTADHTGRIDERPWNYSYTCTKKVTLSNGVERYYFRTGDGVDWWFNYTMEMDVR